VSLKRNWKPAMTVANRLRPWQANIRVHSTLAKTTQDAPPYWDHSCFFDKQQVIIDRLIADNHDVLRNTLPPGLPPARPGEMSVGFSARRAVRADTKKVEKSISLLQPLQEGYRDPYRVERRSSRHVASSGPERTVFLQRRGARRILAGTPFAA
jgi:hypothetical protein